MHSSVISSAVTITFWRSTDGTRVEQAAEVLGFTDPHRAVLELRGVERSGVDQPRAERRVGRALGEVDPAAIGVDPHLGRRVEHHLAGEAPLADGIEHDPAGTREGALDTQDVLDDLRHGHRAPTSTSAGGRGSRLVTLETVEHGEQRLDHDLATGRRFDQLAGEHALAGQGAELAGDHGRLRPARRNG